MKVIETQYTNSISLKISLMCNKSFLCPYRFLMSVKFVFAMSLTASASSLKITPLRHREYYIRLYNRNKDSDSYVLFGDGVTTFGLRIELWPSFSRSFRTVPLLVPVRRLYSCSSTWKQFSAILGPSCRRTLLESAMNLQFV